MGTYTTNYQLYMPTVGERGWGTLINGNYDAIDTTMKGLSNRIAAVESEVNGALSCTSVTTSGTITSNGMLNVNGGVNGGAITGTTITATNRFAGTLYGKVYVNAKTSTNKYNNDVTYATRAAQTLCNMPQNTYKAGTTSATGTVAGYSKISMSYPYQLYPGIYIPSASYLTDSVPSSPSMTATFTWHKGVSTSSSYSCYCYVNGKLAHTLSASTGGTYTKTFAVNPGDTAYIYMGSNNGNVQSASVTVSALSTYYINIV